MFYYAQINNDYLVTQLHQTEGQITNASYIAITQEQYTNGDLVGKYYNKLTNAFEVIYDYMGASTSVSHKDTQMMLSTKIDNMQVEIEGKANANHSHTEYADTSHNHDTAYAPISHEHSTYATTEAVNTALSGKAENNHTHTVATTTASGFLSNTDKSKLDSVEAGANNYTHPATHSADIITGLADVATSGNYNDLANKPTIPTIPSSLPANGGNADTVDNKHASDFATATHNHDTDYADISHTHAQSEITGLETVLSGKSDTTHNHSTVYAPISHSHTQSEITGLSTALNNKADTSHTHTNYVTTDTFSTLEDTVDTKANASHTHAQSDITGLASALNAKANTSHTHSNYALTTDLNTLSETVDGKASSSHTHTLDSVSDTTSYVKMTAAERTKLSGIATSANNITVDSALSSTSTNPVQNKIINTALGNKVDKVSGKGLSTNDYTTTEKNKLAGIATGANNYSHPTYTAKSSGLYKVTVDGTGHISGATAVAKSDITALGIPSTNTTYSNATTSTAGLLSASDKSKLDGVATGANAYTHPTYTAKSSGLYKVTVDGTGHISGATAVTKADITALGIPAQDTNTTYSNATTSTAGLLSASDKSKLDGIATGANKTTVDSALSSTSTNPVQNKVINSALAGKSSTSHNHDATYISKSLQMTADDGDVMVSWTNQDVVAKIKALTTGMYTAYAKSGTTNNPKTTESWRFMVHKTSEVYGWVQAFGSAGSMYIGYVDNDTWKGWKCLYDASPVVLWFGNYWITETQTVTPSKALSECKNGWVLVWSDYDTANEKPTNGDFFTTVIPKKNGANANWSGQSFIATIPHNMSDTKDEITCKRLYVHDTKITGHASNDTSPRNDVCLRAIFEY